MYRNLLITGNKKNIKVKNKKSHHYMMTFNKDSTEIRKTIKDSEEFGIF